MKTTIKSLFAIFAVFAFSNVQAQEYFFGPKLGYVYSNFTDRDAEARDGLRGVAAGVYYEYRSAGLLSFQPELLFTQQGARAEYSNWDAEARIRANYIQLPVLVKLNLPLPILNPYVYGGGYASVLVDKSVEGEMGALSFSSNDVDLKPYDAGALLGAGVNIEVGNILLGAEYRYGLGLVDINDSDNSVVSDFRAENISHFFMINLGIRM